MAAHVGCVRDAAERAQQEERQEQLRSNAGEPPLKLACGECECQAGHGQESDDDRMAEAVAGYVPLVASGHFHVPGARVMDGTLYLRIGSTGGAGAKVFTQVGGVPLSAEVLYFSRTTPRVLVGYDLIEQSPENGSLTVRRHLVSEDFGTLVPTPPSPSPSESPSASEAPALSPTGSASV